MEEIQRRTDYYDEFMLNYGKREKNEIRDNIYLIYKKAENGYFPNTVYVGKTRRIIHKRFTQHLNEVKKMMKGEKEWSVKYHWMYLVLLNGDLSVMLLNKVQRSKVYEFENEWINFFKSNGFRVINRDNSYKINKKVGKL